MSTTTYTPNLHLAKPAEGNTKWTDMMNGNLDTIDALAKVAVTGSYNDLKDIPTGIDGGTF